MPERGLGIYIAGAITGQPDYMALFDEAEQALLAAGVPTVYNPARLYRAHYDSGESWESIMQRCLGLVASSKVTNICMLSNWWSSPGARRELLRFFETHWQTPLTYCLESHRIISLPTGTHSPLDALYTLGQFRGA